MYIHFTRILVHGSTRSWLLLQPSKIQTEICHKIKINYFYSFHWCQVVSEKGGDRISGDYEVRKPFKLVTAQL